MQELDDNALLRLYSDRGSDDAFAQLVARHINKVYSVALRQTRNPDQAEEITQAVFVILARKSGKLDRRVVLSGWLYQTARLTARTFIRSEIRRARREQEAHMQTSLNDSESGEWPRIAPLLDEAMATLGETDHHAVVLRFFDGKSMKEVGTALGSGEDAVKMRIIRAVEKMRRFFRRRGIALSAAGLAAAISANSVQAAPAALTKVVTAAALAKGVSASGSTLTLIKGALKLMAWTKAKTAVVVGVGVLLVAGTTTVTVKRIVADKANDSWRARLDFDSRTLDRAAPQVRIVPTKFLRFGGCGTSNGRLMGLGASVQDVVQAAYDFGAHRIVLHTHLPPGRYDFIASLRTGNSEALRREITKYFGLTAHTEMVETNVLLLTVKHPNAPGLVQSSKLYGVTSYGNGTYHCDGQPISSLAGMLENILGTPVFDRTDLKDKFDIDLKWQDADDLKQRLISQLGLELVPGREPVEMLVVEKAP